MSGVSNPEIAILGAPISTQNSDAWFDRLCTATVFLEADIVPTARGLKKAKGQESVVQIRVEPPLRVSNIFDKLLREKGGQLLGIVGGG